VTEAQFTDQVLDLALLFRWRRFHVRPARTGKGWRTPVQGDGVGWPDLVLIKGDRIVAAELKVGKRKPTAEQLEWLAAFAAAGAETYVWRPDDWDEIRTVLGEP
jgi:hypothetical protein